jgi:hypothetical protein
MKWINQLQLTADKGEIKDSQKIRLSANFPYPQNVIQNLAGGCCHAKLVSQIKG